MLNKLVTVILLSLLFIASSNTPTKINCPLNKLRLFSYESDLNAFGGTQNNEKVHIVGTVGLGCTQKWKNEKGDDVYLMVLQVRDMDIKMENHEQGITQLEVGEESPPNLAEEFKHFSAATVSSSGEVLKVYHDKREKPWVSAMKKEIFKQLQAKMSDGDRVGTDGIGKHVDHFSTLENPDGGIVINKHFTDKDIPKEWTKSDGTVVKKRPMKVESDTFIELGSDGTISNVVTQEAVEIGKKTEQPSYFFDDANIPFLESERFSTKDSSGKDVFAFEGETSLSYIGTEDFQFDHSELIKTMTLSEEIPGVHPTFVLGDNIKETDLAMDSTLVEFITARRAEELKSKLDIRKIINDLVKDPHDVTLTAQAGEYISHHHDVLDLLKETFENVRRENLDNDFLKLAQSLMLSCKCKKGQQMVIETMISPSLIEHAIFRTLEVEDLSEELVNVLWKLSNLDKENVNSLNAYLALADAASRLSEEKARPIVNRIEKDIEAVINNKNATDDLTFYVHAYGNAGDAAPLETLLSLITSSENKRVRKAAIHALRKRFKDDEIVTDVIHGIVNGLLKVMDGTFGGTPFDIDEKLLAIRVQTQRNAELENGASVKEFGKIMFDESQPEELRQAAIQYLAESDDPSALLLLQLFHDSAESISMADSQFLRKVRRAIRRVARGVRRVARRVARGVRRVARGVRKVVKGVGDKIKKAVKGVGNAINEAKKIFKAATFDGHKVCLPASAADDKICMYDKNMLQFIQAQGNLKKMKKAAHFAFEKLLGSGKIHMYVGTVGYAGTSAACSKKNEFAFSVFGRAEARAKVFSKDYNLVSAEATLSYMDRKFNSRMYLKVLGAVMVDRPIIDPKNTQCKNLNKQLVKKDFPKLPSYSITIMIGPVPVSFGFSLHAATGVDQVASICPEKMTAEMGIVPYVSLGISAHAAINIIVAKGGIQVKGYLNYKLYPNLNIDGAKCKVCATLKSIVAPANFDVDIFAQINLIVYKKKWSAKLIGWKSPAETKKLWEKCLNFGTQKLSDQFALPTTEKRTRILSENVAWGH